MDRSHLERAMVRLEAARQMADLARLIREDPYIGWCVGCQEDRRRSQCREIAPCGYPLSLAVWVCATCETPIGEELPF